MFGSGKKWMRMIWAGMILAGAILSPVMASEARVHEVRKGETLYSISRKYGLRIPDVTEANPELTGSTIRIGQKIRIPAKAGGGETPESIEPIVIEESVEVARVPETAPPAPAPPVVPASRPQTYRVQRGDTFSAVSRRFGMSLAELSAANPGVDPARIQVGQILQIAGSPTQAGAPAPAPSPSAIRPSGQPAQKQSATLYLAPILKELDAIPVQKRRWKNVVIHHSATTEGNARYFDYYHRQVKKWENGLAYHFVIGNGVDSGDGQIEIGPRWKRQIQGGHVRGDELNDVSIGICFVGNFEKKRPSRAQFIAVVELLRYLNGRTGRPYPIVWMHKEINPGRTACPGRLFPIRELREIMRVSPQ
ncbi:LysM peptidoglycan-binding domain-containing protein [Oscillatoria laete-virens NRMC-F 0139]|nr:LysM peptidoglycan-binding domain-containing protein [Oscillatoria laete-virens NRMC-F 0139]